MSGESYENRNGIAMYAKFRHFQFHDTILTIYHYFEFDVSTHH